MYAYVQKSRKALNISTNEQTISEEICNFRFQHYEILIIKKEKKEKRKREREKKKKERLFLG